MAVKAVYPIRRDWPKEWKQCRAKGCIVPAIFGESCCWEHLPEGNKTNYKNNLLRKHEEGKPFRRGNFLGVNLEGALLQNVDFREAYLFKANLRQANLVGSDFSKAELINANFQGALLISANFQDAYLLEAKFQNANLSGCNFRGAYLREANFTGAFLFRASWTGSLYLYWEHIKKCGEEQSKRWTAAKEVYRSLESYFREQGQYSDEMKAYYQAMVMEKQEAFEKWFYGRRLKSKPKGNV